MSRIVGWFSCGAASATAVKLALIENDKKPEPSEFIICYTYVENEHPDSMRFLKDCEKWFGQEIVILKDKEYGANVDTVIEKTRYMSGIRGARCTMVLKKALRKEMQLPSDKHIFGYTVGEEFRVDRIYQKEPCLDVYTPLIEKGFTKDMCFAYITNAGIELPEMYKLGYFNNNCIGCLKASGGYYWNKIRVDFPDVFKRRARQEEILGVSLCKVSKNKFKRDHTSAYNSIIAEENRTGRPILKTDKRGNCRIPLRFLPKSGVGREKDLDIGSCGFLCELLK